MFYEKIIEIIIIEVDPFIYFSCFSFQFDSDSDSHFISMGTRCSFISVMLRSSLLQRYHLQFTILFFYIEIFTKFCHNLCRIIYVDDVLFYFILVHLDFMFLYFVAMFYFNLFVFCFLFFWKNNYICVLFDDCRPWRAYLKRNPF